LLRPCRVQTTTGKGEAHEDGYQMSTHHQPAGSSTAHDLTIAN
jgi:hypothetical protein